METRNPLAELCNHRQPRRKTFQTYGKKKGGHLNNQAAYRNIFGQNENSIEERLASLNLHTRNPSPPPSKHGETPKLKVEKDRSISTQTEREQLVSEADSIELEPLLALCDSPVESFTTFGARISKSCQIEKIGEGSFAEVFKLTPSSSKPVSKSGLSDEICSIIKVIPLAHPSSSPTAIDRVSTVSSVAREINLLKHLAILHGFTGFASLRLVKGSWPSSLLDPFHDFRKRYRKRAINASPQDDFDDNQVYALLEMDDAGTEVALIRRPSVFQVYDIFWMTVILLVNAEEKMKFEHRDLHLSNICVKSTTQMKSMSKITSDSRKCLRDETQDPQLDIDPQLLATMRVAPKTKLGLSNMKITIIDYTVARASLPVSDMLPSSASSRRQNSSRHIQQDDYATVYDPMLFTSQPFEATSDQEAQHQFDTYQKCRALATYHATKLRPQSSPDNKWSHFIPKTNTIWLSYLLQVLILRATGRTGKLHILTPPKQTNPGQTSTKNTNTRLVKTLQEEMWQTLRNVASAIAIEEPPISNSKPDSVTKNEEPWTKAAFDRIPGSAKDLLERAVTEGWLSKLEIEEFKMELELDS